jgi:hypothetical protein
MIRRYPRHRSSLTMLLALALAGIQGCGADSSPGTGPGTGTNGLSIILGVATASVRQGELTVAVAEAIRSGGFTGAVTFSVEGGPAGVTSSFSTPSTSGAVTAVTIQINVALTTVPGAYPLTIRAKGAGVNDATSTFTLTVTGAAAQYALTFIPNTLSVPAGGRDSLQVLIARLTGFTGPVTLALGTAATGITATFNPATSSTAITAWMITSVAATVTPGTYPVTVRGSATGQADYTATFQLTVTPGTGSGNVSVDLSGCTPNTILWVAGQDGTGAWTRLTGANDLYRFNVASSKGGVAWVTTFANAQTLHVRYATQAELTASTFKACDAPGTRTYTGPTAGLGATEYVNATLGGGYAQAGPTNPNLSILAVKDGVHDLIAYRFALPDVQTDKIIIRRDQAITGNGAIASLNFGAASAEPFAVVNTPMTFGGVQAADNITLAMGYLTGASCDRMVFKTWFPPQGTGQLAAATVLGVPPAVQRATDFHELAATTSSDNLLSLILGLLPQDGFGSGNESRTVRIMFHTLATRPVVFGAPLAAPTVTSVGGAYKRLQAVVTIPVDYPSSATLIYGPQQGGNSVRITASVGWLGTTTAATIVAPDLSAVAGFSSAWGPPSGIVAPWLVTVTGTNLTTSECVEGGFVKTSRRSGTA